MSRHQGEVIENQALAYLQQRGLRLVERNFNCRRGEIDLVMMDGPTLVFVEVRYRKSQRFGGSAESVDWRKQQKLLTAAQVYLQAHSNLQDRPCRFDVVAGRPDGSATRFQWISDAFRL